jgi:hypothetical protein
MGDKTVKNRDWSGAIGQAARPLPEGAKKVLEKKHEEKKIRELTKGQEAIRPALRPISKK